MAFVLIGGALPDLVCGRVVNHLVNRADIENDAGVPGEEEEAHGTASQTINKRTALARGLPVKFDSAVREMFDASFIPGVRATMCVGLDPEMRTLINFAEEPSGSTAEALVQ